MTVAELIILLRAANPKALVKLDLPQDWDKSPSVVGVHGSDVIVYLKGSYLDAY